MTDSRSYHYLRIHTVVALLILLVTMMVGTSLQPPSASAAGAPPTYGSISGTVTNSSGAPIANVSVTAQGGGGNVASAITAADGTYLIPNLPSDNYTVYFNPTSTQVGQFWNNQQTFPLANRIAVGAGQTVTGINATLANGGSISGTVTDSSGAPISNVNVYASGAQGIGAAAYTAADGTYVITGLDAGSYTVQFSPPATTTFAPQYWNNQSDLGTATPVTVVLGQTVTGISAALLKGGSISGTVTDSSGAPISNVNVYASGASGTGGSASTAADGTYVITGLVADSYTVQFSPSGSTLGLQFWNNKSTQGTATPVVVGVGQSVTGIDAALVQVGTISGTVTDSSGAPVANVFVFASGAAGETGSAVTAADGSYTITGLVPESYTVEFIPSGSTLEAQYWNDQPISGTPTTLVVGDGQAVTGIDAVLQGQPGAIAGTVTDSLNEGGLSNVCVTLWSGSEQLRTSCSAFGAYQIDNVAPGTYTLSFADADGTHVTQWAGGTATQAASTPVVISGDGSTVTVNAAMTGVPGTISGTIHISGQNPSRSECMYLYSPGASGSYAGQATCTNTDGKYLLSGMVPGHYVVAFVDPMGLTPTIWSGGASTQAAATTVTVSAGGATSNVDATPVPASGSVVGRVHNTDYTGISNICVYAFGYNPTTGALASTAAAATCTNAQGGYVLAGLPTTGAADFQLAFVDPTGVYPTAWSISSTLSGDNYSDYAISRYRPDDYVSMSASPIGYISPTLYAGGSITGTVTNTNGTPRVGACVYVDYAQDGVYVGQGARTDGTGNYTLANLTPNLGTEISGGSGYKVGFYATCAAGQLPTTHWNGGASSEAAATSVDVSPDTATSGVDAQF